MVIIFYKELLILIQCKDLATRVSSGAIKQFKTTLSSYAREKRIGIFFSKNGFTDPCNLIKGDDLFLLTSVDGVIDYIKNYHYHLNFDRDVLNSNYFTSSLNIDIFYIYIFFLTLLLFILIRIVIIKIFIMF